MRNSLVGSLPNHIYCFVDTNFTHREPIGFIPVTWFGLVIYPSRMWGCNLLLESGAIYRNIPPHALAFDPNPQTAWTEQDAQTWDCYGYDYSALEYTYLKGLTCKVRANKKDYIGDYLFTVAPIGDGFSAYPEQAKEFTFVKLNNNRLTIQPTNHTLFVEKSFTTNKDLVFPKGLKRQDEIYYSE